jgi:hypothetical protein
MNATSAPTLDTLPDMHSVAAIIAQDARENQAGVDVIASARCTASRPTTACSTP